MDIRRENRQTNHARKAISPIRINPTEPPMLKAIDARFNARMLFVPIGKCRLLLPSAFNLREIPVLRQRTGRQKVIQPVPIGGTMVPPVKAHRHAVRESCRCRFDERNCMVKITAVPHNHRVQNKPPMVCNHAHRHPEFNRDTSFALRDPTGMLCKNRIDLFRVGNTLALQ